MDQTQPAPAGTTDMSVITTTHLIVLAVFAVLVLIGIWWGMKLKRDRRAGAAQTIENQQAIDAAPAAPGSAPMPTATPAPPVAPAPPPLADDRMIATPAPKPAPAVEAAPVETAGDITLLKGLGPKLAATLAELGVTRIDQIAAMSPIEIDALDAQLGTFKGRIARDRWVDQAKLLSAGDKAGYEAAFGKLGG